MTLTVPAFTFEQQQAVLREAQRRLRGLHDLWRGFRRLYRSGHDLEAVDEQLTDATATMLKDRLGLDLPSVNMVRPHLDLMIETTMARDPRPLVQPFQQGADVESEVLVRETVLRYWLHRARITAHARRATEDQLICGNGFLKTSWLHRSEEVERDEGEVAEDLRRLIARDAELVSADGGEPTTFDELRELVPSSELVVDANELQVSYVPPENVFVPPDATGVHDARWLAQRIVVPVEELKANPLFDSDRVKANASVASRNAVEEWSRNHAGDTGPFAYAEVFEFYDLARHELTIFQVDGDEPLWSGDVPHSHRYPPIVHFKNSGAVGTDFFGPSEVENIARLQLTLNEVVSEKIRNMRASGNKYVIDDQLLSENDDLKEALESDQGDLVVAVKGLAQRQLPEVLHHIRREPMSGDVWNTGAELERWMQETLGLNEFQTGGTGPSRMPATAAAVVDGVSTLRAQGKIRAVEDGISELLSQALLLSVEFMPREDVVELVGEERAEFWPVFADDDEMRRAIRREFDVKVEAGSTRAVNPATEYEQGHKLFSELSGVAAQLGYDPEPMLRQGLRKMGLDPDVLLVRAEPPPQPEQPQQPASEPMPAGEPMLPAGAGGEMAEPEGFAPPLEDPSALVGGIANAAEQAGGSSLAM